MTREEALKKIKAWDFLNNDEIEVLETFIPELKESKEEWIEKIRAEIISYLKNRPILSIPEHDAIATWLSWIEKQDKQKPTDKVEPKFEIIQDTWYICTCTTCSEDSRIWFKKGTVYLGKEILKYDLGFEPDDYQNYFRPWTIQDAKDGDVLSAHECIVVFKEIDGLNIKCHCTYHYLNHRTFCIDTLQNKMAFHPATKAQRELLSVGMHEAGYVWDKEKKELKRINHKSERGEEIKFRKFDIITNGKIEYEIRDIQKNQLGDWVYILHNDSIARLVLPLSSLPDGSIRWVCEQVDEQFELKQRMEEQ